MAKALKNARVAVASAGGKIKVKGVSNRYFLLEGKDESDNWAGEINSRKFWGRLVASNAGLGSQSGAGGNPESKY